MASARRQGAARERDVGVELVVLLGAATGVMHAAIAVEFAMAGLLESAARFAGIAGAYVAGAAMVALGIARGPLIRAGIPFVAFVLWAWVMIGERSLFAYLDKAIEVALLLVLIGLVARPERARGR